MVKKKIELNLPNQLYRKLLEESHRENIQLQDYIIKILEDQENDIDGMRSFKKFALKELQQLTAKIKNFEKISNQLRYDISKILPLDSYDSKLPDLLASEINHYRKKRWFNEKYFYLLFDKTSIVGYIGLDFHEEPMPYGQYGYIYSINIKKPYNSLLNLQKILIFLQQVLKKKDIYYIDMSSSNDPLIEKQLTRLGFMEFYSINQAKIVAKKDIEDKDLPKYKIKSVNFNVNRLESFLTVNREIPIKYVFDYWDKNSERLECKKISFFHDDILKESFLICKATEKDHIFRYSLLIKPIDLFDQYLLIQIYKILIKEMNLTKISNELIIEIPEETEGFLKQYVDIISYSKNSWYRKIIS